MLEQILMVVTALLLGVVAVLVTTLRGLNARVSRLEEINDRKG